MPPARPSSPSARLIALVTPTKIKMVKGVANQSAKTTPSGNRIPQFFILIPPKTTTITAARIWAANFTKEPNSMISSRKPAPTIINKAIMRKGKRGIFGAHKSSGTVIPTAMARPPVLGIAVLWILRSWGRSTTCRAYARRLKRGTRAMVRKRAIRSVEKMIMVSGQRSAPGRY